MKNKLRLRLILSFGILAMAMIGAFVVFQLVQSGPKDDEAPIVLRKSFLWNEKISNILKSNKRLSVERPIPPQGKKPRVNGGLGLIGPIDLENHQIHIISGEKRFTLPANVFRSLPKSGYSTEFRCIEGWSEDTQYAGVKFSQFMGLYDLGKKPDGSYFSYVGLETPDGEYYVSVDMESMLHEQTVLAYEMNGAPLSLDNGAPLRLIIPVKYGIKSLKRIGKIFFSDTRPKDYWAERGYDWYSGF